MGDVILKGNNCEIKIDSADLARARVSAHLTCDSFHTQAFTGNNLLFTLLGRFATITDKLMQVAHSSLKGKDRQNFFTITKIFTSVYDVLFVVNARLTIDVNDLAFGSKISFLCKSTRCGVKTKEFNSLRIESLEKDLKENIPVRLKQKISSITAHITEGVVDIPLILESVYEELKNFDRILEFEILCRCDKDSDLFKDEDDERKPINQ